MGDNKAIGLEETISREEKYRRGYFCQRFGSQVEHKNLDDPYWSPWDNQGVSAIHNHRSPFAYFQPTYGLSKLRADKAAGADAAKAATPQPAVPSAPSVPRTPVPECPPPRSSPQNPVVDALLSQAAGALASEGGRLPTGAGEGRVATGAVASRLPTGCGSSPPKSGLSRHSASAGELRQKTGLTQSSRRSLRSHVSAASLRSKISEAVQKEVQRSELKAYYEACEGKKQRKRQAQLDMPVHLRTGTNPIDSGCPQTYLTQQRRSLTLPIQMATDPKWSTDLKRTNAKVGQRIEWESKMAASLSGSIMPEMHYMPPKDYITNPPTPYFKPGEAHKRRETH